jgi:hypothetical protein
MEANHIMPLWQAVFSGMIGLVYIFAGYRTLRFTARVTSGLLFMMVGVIIASHVTHGLVAAAIIVGAGILGFLLGNAFYFVTMSLYGAAAGGVIGWIIGGLIVHAVSWPAIIGGAIGGAVLAILFERPIGIAATSVIGAGATMKALHSALVVSGVHAADRLRWAYVALVAVLTVLGCVVQAQTTKNLPPREASGKNQPAGIR